jgi:hypothetical protein
MSLLERIKRVAEEQKGIQNNQNKTPTTFVGRSTGDETDELTKKDPLPQGGELEEIRARAALFRHQVEQSAGGPVPLLALPGVVSQAGQCLSCGVVLPEGQVHRCLICVAAVRVALGVTR